MATSQCEGLAASVDVEEGGIEAQAVDRPRRARHHDTGETRASSSATKPRLTPMQSTYKLAVVHAQRVVRRFLARASLPRIRQQVEEEARRLAAIEIQRIARLKLARRFADCLRLARNNAMATIIQSCARRMFAVKERRKRWVTYLSILRNDSATEIQRIYRGHMCQIKAQVLAEEKRQRLEAEEKAKIKSREHDCALVIQKHARRIQAKASCRDKRIEMSLHERLLMYTGGKVSYLCRCHQSFR